MVPQGCTCASKAVKSKGKKVQRASQLPISPRKEVDKGNGINEFIWAALPCPGHTTSKEKLMSCLGDVVTNDLGKAAGLPALSSFSISHSSSQGHLNPCMTVLAKKEHIVPRGQGRTPDFNPGSGYSTAILDSCSSLHPCKVGMVLPEFPTLPGSCSRQIRKIQKHWMSGCETLPCSGTRNSDFPAPQARAPARMPRIARSCQERVQQFCPCPTGNTHPAGNQSTLFICGLCNNLTWVGRNQSCSAGGSNVSPSPQG